MDKLFDFKKESWSEEQSKLYRFQCDCLSSSDAMDVLVDEIAEDRKFITITMDFHNSDLWSRIKYAWQIVRGHWAWREFTPREDDYQNLADVFGKKFSELP